MKLPKSVQAPFGPYTVERADAVTFDGAPAYGTCEEETRTIRLDTHLPAAKRREILIHEWLHACLIDGGYDQLLADALHEAMVHYLARCIAQFLPAV